MRANLDLIIPGLFDLPVDVLDRAFLEKDLPAINQFLRYASPIENNIFELEPILSACMGWKNYPVLPFAQTPAAEIWFYRLPPGDHILYRGPASREG